MTSTAHEAALEYRQWTFVIPLKENDKRPAISKWPEKASDEPVVIDGWFAENTGRNVGLLMGPTPNDEAIFALDIDEHDPTQSGSTSLAALEAKYGELPPTVETITPNNGRHLFFRANQPISKSAGRLGPGIDVQGLGSFVVAPPSVHPNGGTYRFRDGHSFDEHPIATAPQWLIDLLTTPEPTVTTARARTVDTFWYSPEDSPADRYNASVTWEGLLNEAEFPFGYTDRTGESHWTHPYKDPSEGTSVTTNYKGQDILYNFSSSIPFLPPGAYSKFQFTAYRLHGGDMSAMARWVIENEKKQTIPTVADPNADEWNEPSPLVENVELPPFPVEVLPQWMRDQVNVVAENIQVDVALPACLGLGALCSVTLANCNVYLPSQHWDQPANLYICVVMDPSAGKSPAKAAMFKAVQEIETFRQQMARSAIMRHDAQQKILDKKMKGVQDRLAKTTGADHDAATADLFDLIDEIAALEQAPNGRMTVEDITTEALVIEMKKAGGAISQVSSEGGMFNILGGQYSDGIANIDVYLEGYSGGSLQQDRVTREPIVIPRANLGITVTVQPSIIDAVGSNEALNNRGLVARFLIAIPPNNVGFRDRRRVTRVSPTIERTYAAQLRDIADRTKQRPLHLTVGEEATRVFADWDQEHEDLCQPGQRYEDLASTIGKMRANIQRIAALLHVAHAHDKVTDIIGADVMADAITIGNYFLQHRVGLQAQWGTDGVALQARSILEWAIRNERTEFTRREMMRGLKRRFADVESTVAPLRRLVECGWLRASGDLAGLKTASQGTASLTLTMHPHAQQYIEVRKHEPSVSPVYPVSPKDVFSHTSLSQTKEPSPPRPPGDTGDTGDSDPIRRSGLFDPEP